MAIQADLNTSTGPVATYHRIAHLRVSWESRVAVAVVINLWNEESRDQGLGALGSAEIPLHGDDFPFTTDHLNAMRSALSIQDNVKLLNLDVTFDKAGVYCQAALEGTLLGQRSNWQQQYPQVPKETLPVNFLEILYPLIKTATFSDGRGVGGPHLANGTEV